MFYIILFQYIICIINNIYENSDVSKPKIGCIKKMNISSGIGITGPAWFFHSQLKICHKQPTPGVIDDGKMLMMRITRLKAAPTRQKPHSGDRRSWWN